MVDTVEYFFRLMRTVQHLRLPQITNRIARKLRWKFLDTAPAPTCRRQAQDIPLFTTRSPAWDGKHGFDILARREQIRDSGDWNQSDFPKLWLYHLHYFEDLLRPDAGVWRDRHASLIKRWIAENPPVSGVGWDPYPISLRVVFWIKWGLSGGTLEQAMLDSLALQLRHLENSLEYHLLGNHLWANAKALCIAGLFFEGSEADRWYQTGLGLLERERREQILPDGGHFERSPAYHTLILEDVLDLLAISRAFGRPLTDAWTSCAKDMLHWLVAMTRDDGQIIAWNDAGTNAVPAPGNILAYAQRLGFDSSERNHNFVYLSDSGYIRASHGPFSIWFDVAPIGPDYIPGHAHADSLNVEIMAGGRPLVVDTGTSTYDTTARRAYERGTSAHNCVTVKNDTDSSEMWGSFRVGRRARTRLITLGPQVMGAAHDGYSRFGIEHRRTISMTGTDMIHILDELIGSPATGTLRFHLAPGLATTISGTTVETPLANFEFIGALSVQLENCEIADGFNRLKPAKKIAVTFDDNISTVIHSPGLP